MNACRLTALTAIHRLPPCTWGDSTRDRKNRTAGVTVNSAETELAPRAVLDHSLAEDRNGGENLLRARHGEPGRLDLIRRRHSDRELLELVEPHAPRPRGVGVHDLDCRGLRVGQARGRKLLHESIRRENEDDIRLVVVRSLDLEGIKSVL